MQLHLLEEDPATLLAGVVRECERCQACYLHALRRRPLCGRVSSEGLDIAACEVMFIGEAPTQEDEDAGEVFSGFDRVLLDRLAAAMSLDRYFVTNVVACSLGDHNAPSVDALSACRHFVKRQVDLVKPRVIVALGLSAGQALSSSRVTLEALRGKWFSAFGVPVRVTHHPTRVRATPLLKIAMWEDMQAVMERLA